MKYLVGRESKSGRFVTINKDGGKTSVSIKDFADREAGVRPDSLSGARKVANSALGNVGSKR